MSPFRIFLSLVCQILGFSLFLKGFFPRKVTLSGFSSFNELSSPFITDQGAHFDKLIFMVVDALRSDFMFSSSDSSMPFLHSLIRDGAALPYTAFSQPPTVTLPRLKGITTGGTPSFVDAIFNIADDNDQTQGLEKVDSWLYQFKNSKPGRKIHFYGDDTWLKLFPPDTFFDRFDGTTSFFVSDFTEVDHNVTRHLQSEMNDSSWDALILHYLGLDHIGHKGGSKSPFMASKQAEMDEVLRDLYLGRVAEDDRTLLVMLGDHGMNDIGNHGGASMGETSPGLIFASPKFSKFRENKEAPLERASDYQYYSRMSQIDLVPTLSALFNFPIPKNSLGILLPELLGLWPDNASRKAVLLENCKQFLDIVIEKYTRENSKCIQFINTFRRLKNHGDEPLESYFSFLESIQNLLIAESTNYSYTDILLGSCIILLSTLMTWFGFFKSLFADGAKGFAIYTFFAAFCALYSLHFHGSSLVEEEHQIWWLFSITVLSLYFCVSRFRVFGLFAPALVCLRLIRAWNDSGQKHVTDYTISKFLVSNPAICWFLVAVTYLVACSQFIYDNFSINASAYDSRSRKRFQWNNVFTSVSAAMVISVTAFSLSFKLTQSSIDGLALPPWVDACRPFISKIFGNKFGDKTGDEKKILQNMSTDISRTFFAGLLAIFLSQMCAARLGSCRETLVRRTRSVVTLFLIHQSRLETIPIYSIFFLLDVLHTKLFLQLPHKKSVRVVMLALFTLCLQNLSFFSVGNTNSLATVDLSNAYNGVAVYGVVSVGFLTFVSNFAVAIFWSISAARLLAENSHDKLEIEGFASSVSFKAFLNMAFYSIAALSLVASCVNLRFHLFIWSVFSPKLLFFSVWISLVNVGVDFALSSFMQVF